MLVVRRNFLRCTTVDTEIPENKENDNIILKRRFSTYKRHFGSIALQKVAKYSASFDQEASGNQTDGKLLSNEYDGSTLREILEEVFIKHRNGVEFFTDGKVPEELRSNIVPDKHANLVSEFSSLNTDLL